MTTPLFILREVPKYGEIRDRARRYPDIDPDSVSAYILLLRIASDIAVRIEAFLAARHLSRARFTVLMILNKNPDTGLPPVELSRKCTVTRATMTGLLDGLERDGLILRADHETDRRMQSISLTPRARKLLDGMLPEYYRLINSLMAPLGRSEKHEMARLLCKIGKKMELPAEN